MTIVQPAHESRSTIRQRAAIAPREIAPGVYWLPLHGSNVYFVGSDNTWALIDTSWGKSANAIQQAAETLFGAGAHPEGILLTHVHPDHTGAAHELAHFWDCPVYLHPDELPLTVAQDIKTVERHANPMDRWAILPLVRVLPRRKYEGMLARSNLHDVVRTLDSDGSVLGLPDWRCIHTPGHAPGHVAFFRESDRVLISGDAVLTAYPRRLGKRGNRPHVSSPPWYTNWDRRKTKASLQVLTELDPRVLASGHGTPLTGPNTAATLRALATEQIRESTDAR